MEQFSFLLCGATHLYLISEVDPCRPACCPIFGDEFALCIVNGTALWSSPAVQA